METINIYKKAREKAGMTQERAAELIPINKNTLGDYERGEYDKDKNKNEYLDLLDKISKILDCSVVDLLKEDDKEIEQISFSEGQIVIDVKGKIDKKIAAMELINLGVQPLNEI